MSGCSHANSRISEPHLAGARECNNCGAYKGSSSAEWSPPKAFQGSLVKIPIIYAKPAPLQPTAAPPMKHSFYHSSIPGGQHSYCQKSLHNWIRDNMPHPLDIGYYTQDETGHFTPVIMPMSTAMTKPIRSNTDFAFPKTMIDAAKEASIKSGCAMTLLAEQAAQQIYHDSAMYGTGTVTTAVDMSLKCECGQHDGPGIKHSTYCPLEKWRNT